MLGISLDCQPHVKRMINVRIRLVWVCPLCTLFGTSKLPIDLCTMKRLLRTLEREKRENKSSQPLATLQQTNRYHKGSLGIIFELLSTCRSGSVSTLWITLPPIGKRSAICKKAKWERVEPRSKAREVSFSECFARYWYRSCRSYSNPSRASFAWV